MSALPAELRAKSYRIFAPGADEIEIHVEPDKRAIQSGIPQAAEPDKIPEITVREIVQLYLHHLQGRLDEGDYDDENFANLRRSLTAFADRFGALTASQVRRHNLDTWVAAHPRWKAARTKKREIGYITACFNWAEDKQHITVNPYRAYRLGKVRLKPRGEATDSQYLLVMRTSSPALRRVIFFQRHCGTRTCEPRELLWMHVRFDQGVIVQYEHKTSRQQEEPAPRVIPLPRCVLSLLKILFRKRPTDTDHVFLDDAGSPWTRDKLCHEFKRAARLAIRNRLVRMAQEDPDPQIVAIIPDRTGDRSLCSMAKNLVQLASRKRGLEDLVALEKVTLYCFRHQKTTELVEEGTPDQQICDLMGWTSPAMLKNYKHTSGKLSYFQSLHEKLGRKRKKPARKSREGTNQTRLFE